MISKIEREKWLRDNGFDYVSVNDYFVRRSDNTFVNSDGFVTRQVSAISVEFLGHFDDLGWI